jgi:hypothetical protein
MITTTQNYINIKTPSLRNGDEPEKESYLHFLLQMISTTVSVNIVLGL